MANLYDERVLGTRQKIALAQKLRESGQESLQGQMIGDRYVPASWTQHLAQGLKQGLGAYQEMKGEQELKDIQKERNLGSIESLSSMGLQATPEMLKQAGTPEQTPSLWKRAGALLSGEDQPQTIPAQPYQQNVAQNVTPEQFDAGALKLMGYDPAMATGAIGLSTNRAAREVAALEKTYQHKLKTDEAAAKVEAARLVAEAKALADKDTNELRIQIAELGNAGKTTKSGWEMLKDPTTGMAIGRYNPETGTSEMLQGGAGAGGGKASIDATETLKLLEQAAPLIKGSTSSYLGAGADQFNRVFGVSSKGADTAASLKTIAGLLTSKMPKMSGPQSDKDVELYKEMAGRIGDSTIPTSQKMAAMQTINEINARHAGVEPIKFNFDPEALAPVINSGFSSRPLEGK